MLSETTTTETSAITLTEPDRTDLQHLQGIYDSGRMLQAYRYCQRFAPFKVWQRAESRVLAARLASNLGAHQLSRVLHWSVWKSDKSNPDAQAYHGGGLLHDRGPLAPWQFFRRYEARLKNESPDALSHYFSVRAMVAAHFRDWNSANGFLDQARELGPESAWLAVSHSHVLEIQDRYQEALEAARRALAVKPWYRPGVQAYAHLLRILDRDDEACSFLEEASRELENMHVTRQLALLQQNRGRYDEAVASLARFEELAPLRRRHERLWLKQQRLTLDCLRGDRGSALSRAKELEDPYSKSLAARLEEGGHHGQVHLPVPFVRQHHMTCAPATLSALARFWGRTAEHLEVAEAICYDGTPSYSERTWAEEHGFVAREFTLTWEASRALLDKGIPFTLTTSEIDSGHLQAVVGYDELRQTLRIRDPFNYSTEEFVIGPLLERYAASGPRGMALVPCDRATLLEAIELPDQARYDQLHLLEAALAGHRRTDAAHVLSAMTQMAPEHRLTLTARRAVASYDSNTPALLLCLDSLLQQFPNDGNLNLVKLNCLKELARREERVTQLERLCTQSHTDPIFWQEYVHELMADGRQHATAATWAGWSLRYRPNNPAFLATWANLLWERREFEQATEWYRLAACLGDKRESFARSFFIASRHLRQTDKALEFLRWRETRLGAQSCQPAITLVESLQHAGRAPEAFSALESALARRPEDGALLLYAADWHARFSRFEQARDLLGRAQPRCAASAWHRVAAGLAEYENRKTDARQHWREVLSVEPLAHDAIRATAELVAQTEGPNAAVSFLNELSAKFPCSCQLLSLRVQWIRDNSHESILPYLQETLRVNPTEAWAWRELALRTSAQPDGETQAMAAADEAVRLEPTNSRAYSVRGEVLLKYGHLERGRTELREALRLEIDNDYALPEYVASAPGLTARKQALEEVTGELQRQVIFRDALSAFQRAARGVLPPQEVRSLLEKAHRDRPDLWQSWSVLVNELVDATCHEDALALARQATDRFPLLPRLWVDLARVHEAQLDTESEIKALEKSLEISPSYAFAARKLSEAFERKHDLEGARKTLERAVAINPLDPVNHGGLAHILWKTGHKDDALNSLQTAVKLQPGYDWAWNALRDWSHESGRPELAVELARELTQLRPGERASWLILAKTLELKTSEAEIFQALDKAISLDPRCVDCFDSRARLLAELGRFDESLKHLESYPAHPAPAQLRIRAAWIEARRGNLSKAISSAQETLSQEPDFYGGWRLLADWHVQNQDLDQAAVAAEKMALLAPLQPVPLGYLADLRLRMGQRALAEKAFARAFALDPDYQYAGFELFRLQLEDANLTAASKTLANLRKRGENHGTLACAVRLAVFKDQFDDAFESFASLCRLETAEPWSLGFALAGLETRPCRKRLARFLAQLSASPAPTTAFTDFWLQCKARRRQWNLHHTLSELQRCGELGRHAVISYLDNLGAALQEARRKKDFFQTIRLRRHLRRIIGAHEHWLRDHPQGWGKTGYVLACNGKPQPVIDWLGNWKDHPQAESWVLYNLVTMLHKKGDYEKSREVIRHAVNLPHSVDLFADFTTMAAFEEACCGNCAAAEKFLAALPRKAVRAFLLPVRALTEVLVQFESLPPAERSAFLGQIRRKIPNDFNQNHPIQYSRYVAGAFRRSMRHFGEAPRSLRFRMWAAWYYRGTGWVALPLLVASLPFVIAAPPLGIPLAIFLYRKLQPK